MATAKGELTKRAVEAVDTPAPGKRAYLWDGKLSGFGVMVTDTGKRSYLVQYRVGGRGSPTRRVTIGRHGSPWTTEKARDRAAELLEQVRRKVDPFDAERERVRADRERKAAEAAADEASTRLAFSTVSDQFIKKYAKVQQARSWRDTDSIFRRDLKPHFGERPLPAISRADIVGLLDKVQERGDSAAVKAYKALRVMFGWAVDRHLITASPMATMKPPAKTESRERALTDAELRFVWLAAGGLGWPFGPIVRLLILTGQRRDEVGELHWPELDTDKASWLLPAERSKNGMASLVPLSAPALSIVDDLPKIKNDGELVFTTTGETPVSGFSKIKRRLDASMLDLMRKEARDAGGDDEAIDKIKLEPWRLHDLRRTFASGCQRLGIRLEVVEAALNHVSGSRSGIVGVYQVYRFEDEKRDAMAAWARHVTAIVQGERPSSNVVPMERRP
jgi:integrase